MDIAFPYPVKLRASIPSIDGLRYSPFTNIDGETFAKPALNGFWRLNIDVAAFSM